MVGDVIGLADWSVLLLPGQGSEGGYLVVGLQRKLGLLQFCCNTEYFYLDRHGRVPVVVLIVTVDAANKELRKHRP